MRLLYILLTLCLLAAPSMLRADEAESAKEGFKEVHEGMKKVTKSVGKKAKKDLRHRQRQEGFQDHRQAGEKGLEGH